MVIRKLPLQPIELKGELKEFTYIAMIDPPASSFFISIAVSLLEALIRLSLYPEITKPTWDCLLFLSESSKETAKKYNLQALHSNFQSLISDLSVSSRKEALQIFFNYLATEDLLSLDYGFRFILMATTKSPLLIKGKPRNYENTLNLLSQKLKINVFLAFQNKYKVMKSSRTSPLICLYMPSPHNFAILYHRAAKYLDEKAESVNIDPLNFPFTDTTINLQSETENMSAVLDLISFLANNISFLPPLLQIQLRNKTEAAGKELDGVLAINSLANLSEKFVCPHISTDVLMPCGKIHCKECLRGSEKCPCGLGINGKDVKIRSFSSGRGRSPRLNSNLPMVKEKIVCLECRKPGDIEDFALVACKDHKVCVRCRAKRVGKGVDRCVQCTREYLPDEKALLLAVYTGLTS